MTEAAWHSLHAAAEHACDCLGLGRSTPVQARCGLVPYSATHEFADCVGAIAAVMGTQQPPADRLLPLFDDARASLTEVLECLGFALHTESDEYAEGTDMFASTRKEMTAQRSVRPVWRFLNTAGTAADRLVAAVDAMWHESPTSSQATTVSVGSSQGSDDDYRAKRRRTVW